MRCKRIETALLAFSCAVLSLLAPSGAVAQSSDPAAARPIARGARFKSDAQPFEMWIPKGFRQSRRKGTGETETRFFGGGRGADQIAIRYDPNGELADYVEQIEAAMQADSESLSIETVEELKAGPYPAVILFCTGLDEKTYRGLEVVVGAFSTGEAVTEVIGYVRKGEQRKTRAIEQLRWMLGTVRAPGSAGLDAFLNPRRVHAATGVYYRSHQGFVDEEKAAATAAALIHVANDQKTQTRLAIECTEMEGTSARRKQDGLLRQDVPWQVPSDETKKLTGSYYAAKGGDRGMAFVGCAFTDGFCVRVCVSGPVSNRAYQINVCERVALGLEHTDIAEARARVQAAVSALDAALAKRRRKEVDEHARTLADYAFLDAARVSLAGALHRITNAKTQAAVVTRLAETGQADLSAPFLRTLKHSNTKKRDGVRRALLLALGEVRDKRAISELLKHAKRGSIADAGAAIRSLGRYGEASVKKRVTKELIRLYAKVESTGKKTRKMTLRDRWTKLAPKFQAVLERLTGQKFESAVEASAWLRKPRG